MYYYYASVDVVVAVLTCASCWPQIMLAIDDSFSMRDNDVAILALQSVSVLCRALTQLQVTNSVSHGVCVAQLIYGYVCHRSAN